MSNPKQLFERRKRRTRYRIKTLSGGRPRLSVFRSQKHIYAQVIDTDTGAVIAAASTNEKDARGTLPKGTDTDAAGWVGRTLAQRAKDKGIAEVVFDRGGYIYHGRVRALAEGAREAGLSF